MGTRITKLKEILGQNFEAAIINSAENRYYLLNVDTHSAGNLLVLPNKSYFIIDSRYIEIARNNIKDPNVEVVLEKVAKEQIVDILKSNNVKNVHIEYTSTLSRLQTLKDAFGKEINIDISDKLTAALNDMRAIKDENEIENIKKAQVITDNCLAHILKYLKPGVREIDIAIEMESYMRKNGAGKIAFNTIMLAGAKTSLPHGEPGDNIINAGDFITMDFGANVNGYCTDMTRTVAMGNISKEQEKVYNIVLKAQLAACEGAKAGLRGCDVDKIARDIITSEGYGDNFGHGLGHSLGIDIHENPRFSPLCTDEIKENMLMTIEPGIYLAGKFGVRIEDTVIMKKDGIEILAKSDKNLIVL